MGFKHWYQGLEMICWFLFVVALPCIFIALWGTRMVNDIGNHPSKSDSIQASAGWKILLIEAISFTFLIGLYAFLFNLNNE